MIFVRTKLKHAFIIELEKLEDERGWFARSWCQREFREQGLDSVVVQCSMSFNTKKGTVRGMHYQLPPFAETKLVRCMRGALYDVIIDLRPDSRTFLQWVAVELSAENGRTLYVPKGFAHGFQTLEDNTEAFYQMSEFYAPEHSRGVRWNDPLFDIAWPDKVSILSEKDQAYEDADPAQFSPLLSTNPG